jgi:hypothetical protein
MSHLPCAWGLGYDLSGVFKYGPSRLAKHSSLLFPRLIDYLSDLERASFDHISALPQSRDRDPPCLLPLPSSKFNLCRVAKTRVVPNMALFDASNSLDRASGHLKTSTLMLNRQRNSRTPICRLPDELLVLIMRELQVLPNRPDPQRNQEFFDFEGYDISWIWMTWVCQHIRDVALNSPELWTWMCSKQSKKWHALVVSRAQDADLCINLLYVFSGDVKNPAEHLSQAQYALIETWGELVQLRDVPAVRLTILHICRLPNTTSLDFLVSLSHQLVELSVSEADIKLWPELVWPRLRRFGLNQPRIHPRGLTGMFGGMDQVEMLWISYMQFPGPDSQSESIMLEDVPRPDALSRLRRIFIRDKPARMLTMLNILSQFKNHHNHPDLDLHADHPWDLTIHVPVLLTHLRDEWGWTQLAPSTTPISDKSLSSDQYSFVLKPYSSLAANNNPAVLDPHAARMQVFFTLGRDKIFAEYRFTATALEVEGAGERMEKNYFNELDQLLSPSHCPNITRIVFRSLRDTQVPTIHAWVEVRRASGLPVPEVVFE